MAKRTTKNTKDMKKLPAPQLQVVPAPARQDLTGLTDEQSRELKELIRKINSSGEKNRRAGRADDDLPPAA